MMRQSSGLKYRRIAGEQPPPGPPCKHDHRRALGIAALLDIELVAIAHIQHPLVERVDRREQMCRCALLAGELVHRHPI
jgi:hypothetical protein